MTAATLAKRGDFTTGLGKKNSDSLHCRGELLAFPGFCHEKASLSSLTALPDSLAPQDLVQGALL